MYFLFLHFAGSGLSFCKDSNLKAVWVFTRTANIFLLRGKPEELKAVDEQTPAQEKYFQDQVLDVQSI